MSDLCLLQFDAQAIEALEALGFTIADDRMAARIIMGDLDVTIIRPANISELEFQLTIILPNGAQLTCSARRRALLDACAARFEHGESG